MQTKRLNQALASAGVSSRRGSDQYIFDGRVKINNEVVTDPSRRINWEVDEIAVDDQVIKKEKEKVYLLLNKPTGFICSSKKGKGEKIVLDLFFPFFKDFRLFTVGRLDKDTSGLIIVTNDGNFTQNLIHPSKNITKEYLVKTKIDPSSFHLKEIAKGVWIDGRLIQPKSVKKVRKNTLKIVVNEGKNHEVRLLIKKVKLHLTSLKRIRLGPLVLGALAIGTYRKMSFKEIQSFLS